MLNKEELALDENGNIPVWGRMSAGGKIYYSFNLTPEDKFIMFPQVNKNPKAPKFVLKLSNPEKFTGGEG